MPRASLTHIQSKLDEIKHQQLWKGEKILEGPQEATIYVDGKNLVNFCANNYLGLSNHPGVIRAAHRALDRWGYGLSSVRFISGTQTIHLELERRLSRFFSTDDTILYSSCFDANAGLFETIAATEDAIISDGLNHASLIDGIRLSKAKRVIFQHLDMADLEVQLQAHASARSRIIVTDGVFSMDGDIADLPTICALAERYSALVVVDDSHATGILGPTGRGTPELHGVQDRVDVVTSTFGKALGGASGGFITGRKEIIELLRQRSRPYLFSNSLAPVIVATSIPIIDLLESQPQLRQQLQENTNYFRRHVSNLELDVRPGSHPIVPIMLYDASRAKTFAEELGQAGIYVISFSYPVVPPNQARIRVQISAAHTRAHLDQALTALEKIARSAKP